MDSNVKNMIVLKNLPSNLVEEAIVILKQNKKARKYEYIDMDRNKNVNPVDSTTEKIKNSVDNAQYIIKEAENVVSHYLSAIEQQSAKGKKDVKKLQKRYNRSVKLNYILGFATIISLVLSVL